MTMRRHLVWVNPLHHAMSSRIVTVPTMPHRFQPGLRAIRLGLHPGVARRDRGPPARGGGVKLWEWKSLTHIIPSSFNLMLIFLEVDLMVKLVSVPRN